MAIFKNEDSFTRPPIAGSIASLELINIFLMDI